LRNLNGFRDAAAHDVVDISEGLLYAHAQSAVQIFGTLLKKAFNKDLARLLPRRVLPLSTSIPSDIHTVIDEDMATVKSLLGSRRRREDEAEAKLRPYEVIEKNIRAQQGVSDTAVSASKMLRKIKTEDWKVLMPMVAGLVQSTPSGIPMSLHVTKRDGFAVRIDPTAPTALAFRYIKPEDKYPYLANELASKLGITTPKLVALVQLFQMRGNDDFHMSMKVSKSSFVSRYSEKAREVMSNAIQREGMDQLWTDWKSRKHRDVREYLENAKASSKEASPAQLEAQA
jgi:hypothetical protein